MTKENRPHEEGGTRSGGPDEKCNAPAWPGNLATPDLEKLVRSLATGAKAAYELPPCAETENIVHAHAVAQIALRRRRAEQRIENARRALDESGWSV